MKFTDIMQYSQHLDFHENSQQHFEGGAFDLPNAKFVFSDDDADLQELIEYEQVSERKRRQEVIQRRKDAIEEFKAKMREQHSIRKAETEE